MPRTPAQPPAWAAALVSRLDAIEAKLAAPASAPASTGEAAAPVLVGAPGHKMSTTRAANLAGAVAGKHCPACKVGFAFRKATCPRCGATL